MVGAGRPVERLARVCGPDGAPVPELKQLGPGEQLEFVERWRPLHPGLARLLRMPSLPDDAFDERFAGSAEPERAHGLAMTRVGDFVRERVREAGITPAA